jgi:hypothetical protein
MWDWFSGKQTEQIKSLPSIPKSPKMNYRNLSKDKIKLKQYLLSNPQDMFKVVDIESDCMCMESPHCDHFLTDVTLFELIIRNKTLTEADLCELERDCQRPLDWFKISEFVPLSHHVLHSHQSIMLQ